MLSDGLSLIQGSSIVNLTVDSGTSFPTSPSDGEMFFRTDSNSLFVYTNNAWTQVATLADLSLSINNQTGTTYTLVASDANSLVRMNNVNQQTVTIPLNSSVPFAIGDKIEIYRAGSGFTTIVPATGVTLNNDNVSVNEKNSTTLIKVGTDSWDIVGQSSPLFTNNSVKYADKFAYFGNQETMATGMFFSSDGLNMYVNGRGTDSVYQYTLSTAWDVSTATYANKSLNVGTQDTFPQGVFFRSNGLSMYMVGDTNNSVYQYTLSIAWDVSTATYANKFISIASQETSPTEVFFSSDGLNMYITGLTNSGNITQYTLSTAWDVSTATYANKTLNLRVHEVQPYGLFFTSDGLTMYYIGNDSDAVHQYTLSTAWDVSTATYANRSVYIGDKIPFAPAVFFKPDGTKMYICSGSSQNIILQYDVAV